MAGGFWGRVEAWLTALLADRPRLARYLQVAWWISTGFVLLGAVLAFLILAGLWQP